MRSLFIFSLIMLVLNSCGVRKLTKSENHNNQTYCVNDTILDNRIKLDYEINEKENRCYLTVSINGISQLNPDIFYYDSMDCRMIPKVLHMENNEVFLISGTGFNYRKLYRYGYSNSRIYKTEIQYDVLEYDEKHTYYPYFKENGLYVLIENKNQKFTTQLIKENLKVDEVRDFIIVNNEISLTINGMKVNIILPNRREQK